MKILSIRRLRGPNVYLSRPGRGRPAAPRRADRPARPPTSTGFAERLLRALPGLAEHHCAAGAPGGFVSRLRGGTYFGHVTEHVCLELSQLIGRDVSFGRTVAAGEPGHYDLILECPVDESPDSRCRPSCCESAVDLVTAVVLAHRSPGWPSASPSSPPLAEREATGPSTAAIIAAARRRGIPVERFADLSLLRLGWGNRRRLAWAAMTDRTSGVGIDIAGDKQVTRRLLAEAGVPVVPGGAASHRRGGGPAAARARRAGRGQAAARPPGRARRPHLGTPERGGAGVRRGRRRRGGRTAARRPRLPGAGGRRRGRRGRRTDPGARRRRRRAHRRRAGRRGPTPTRAAARGTPGC